MVQFRLLPAMIVKIGVEVVLFTFGEPQFRITIMYDSVHTASSCRSRSSLRPSGRSPRSDDNLPFLQHLHGLFYRASFDSKLNFFSNELPAASFLLASARIRLWSEVRRIYSLMVRPAFLARSLMMAFSPSVILMKSRRVAPSVPLNLATTLSCSVGSRGVALSKMRNHISE